MSLSFLLCFSHRFLDPLEKLGFKRDTHLSHGLMDFIHALFMHSLLSSSVYHQKTNIQWDSFMSLLKSYVSQIQSYCITTVLCNPLDLCEAQISIIQIVIIHLYDLGPIISVLYVWTEITILKLLVSMRCDDLLIWWSDLFLLTVQQPLYETILILDCSWHNSDPLGHLFGLGKLSCLSITGVWRQHFSNVEKQF